jgi:hypothetical protein
MRTLPHGILPHHRALHLPLLKHALHGIVIGHGDGGKRARGRLLTKTERQGRVYRHTFILASRL